MQLIFTLWIQISFTNFAFVNSAFLTWLQLCGTWHSVWNQLWYLLGSLIRILACVHFTSVQGIWFCLFKNDTLTLQVMEKKRERERESKLQKLFVIVGLKSLSLDLDSRNWNWHHELFPNLIACVLYCFTFSWPFEIRPHLQSTIIDSFDIYLVCIILSPPSIIYVAITSQKVGKMLTMVYALRSYWDPLCFLRHTPFPWLFKMHPLVWPSLTLGWVLTASFIWPEGTDSK